MFYNHARNAADQDLREEVILPVQADALKASDEEGESSIAAGTSFEPSSEEVLDRLLPAYVETVVYHALIDSAAAEQGRSPQGDEVRDRQRDRDDRNAGSSVQPRTPGRHHHRDHRDRRRCGRFGGIENDE